MPQAVPIRFRVLKSRQREWEMLRQKKRGGGEEWGRYGAKKLPALKFRR